MGLVVNVKGVDYMEKIILVIIGVVAVGFIVRLFWKEAKGEVQCNCAEGKCGGKKDIHSGKKK